MKKYLFVIASLLLIGTATTQGLKNKKYRNKNKEHFTIKDRVVYYDEKPLAKYQAKTYSLDNNELVEEYNMLLLDNQITNKQLIGDLIDYISDRHSGAEVEVEIDANGSVFEL
ncbi:MAG: hypothetical protein ACK55K_02130 [Bacteroidota bacterium]